MKKAIAQMLAVMLAAGKQVGAMISSTAIKV
jgi:hypothetical protein